MEGQCRAVRTLTAFACRKKNLPVMVKSLFSITVNVGIFVFHEMNL